MPSPLRAEEPPGIIQTIAGGANGDGRMAQSAVVDPHGVALCQQSAGAPADLYIADGEGNRIRRVDGVTGVITTVAGTGLEGFGGDGGLATDAQLSCPLDVACDADGNIYVADGWSTRRVRKIDRNGRISTIAGNGMHDFSGDNVPATQTGMMPYALTADAAGNVYIADADNRRVRKVGLDGVIVTVAGNGTYGSPHDGGRATQEALGFPSGVAVDASGRLYIADYANGVVYQVTNDVISAFAGDGLAGFGGDGETASRAHLLMPNRVAADAFGNVLILDQGNHRVRRVGRDGIISTVAGNGTVGSAGDGGPGTSASLYTLRAVATDPAGNVYIGTSVDSPSPWSYDNRVRKLDMNGTIDTVVGIGDNGDGSSALDAVVDPHGLAIGRRVGATDLYVADSRGNQVRKVDGISGAVSTVAGTGEAGFAGDDGLATAAQLSFPSDVAVDAEGNVYIADQNNDRVRRVDVAGIITTVAGSGAFGYNGDGQPAVTAALAGPTAVDVDAAGNVYIADGYSHRIRKVTRDGVIATVAGNGTYSPLMPLGDGGLATEARLCLPTDVIVAPDGSFYVAEFWGHRLRKVAPNGIISTVAGTGSFGYAGDGGLAMNAQLNGPLTLALDVVGNVYVGDSNNLRVRRIEAASGLITTVAGNGNPGDEGDGGPATSANLYAASGLAADASGYVYIAQADSSRIRQVRLDVPSAILSPSTVVQPELRYFRRRRGSVQVSVYVPRPGGVQRLDAEIAYDRTLLATPRVTPMRIARGAVVTVNEQVPGRLTIALASAAPIRAGRVLTIGFATKGTTRPPAASVSLVKGTAVRMQ